jgi:hypothetical protein
MLNLLCFSRLDEFGDYHSPNICFAGIGAYLADNFLNVSLKVSASIVSPATLGLALASAAPTSTAQNEVGAGSGYTPQTLTMSSVSTGGSLMVASNASSCLYGTFNSSGAISGVVVKDTLAQGTGNIYYFGNLATARTVLSGDSIIVAAAALTITLS